MRKDHFLALLDKYMSGEASPAERRLLEEYYDRMASAQGEGLDERDRAALEELMEGPMIGQEGPWVGAEGALPDPVMTGKRGVWRIKRRWMAVAAVLCLLCAGVYLWGRHGKIQDIAKAAPAAKPVVQNDITPGGNKALLTLANGTVIVLDTARNGVLTQQTGVKAVKLTDGQLAYNTDNSGVEAITYNTLSTPRGGQYKVTLADGSNVWLNAASSLRYPTGFRGDMRVVEIRGEAYFEIAGDPSKPFVVKVNGVEVKVLGTAFDVMAYEDEADIRTSLLTGGVQVSKGGAVQQLKPGQQARIAAGGAIRLEENPDMDEVLAWKNNLFSFNDADIQSVMRQIGRWYDVDVAFEGNVSKHFNGNIPRSVNVSKVFRMLELTGSVHFRIENKRIVVSE